MLALSKRALLNCFLPKQKELCFALCSFHFI